ncbi:MAG TPA: hypothetical protein VFX30_11565 [bacterium]|nr:hypothetical protein [bacterium]
MNIRTLSASLACLIALSACGGGNTTDSSKSALDGACTPASGPAGTQVTCAVKDIDEDCTFFFAGRPTDFAFDAENGSFSFTVPTSIVGSEDMSFQCGDGEPLSAGTFNVTSSAVEDAPAADADEIQPEDTGAGTAPTWEGTTGGGTTGGDTAGTTEPVAPVATTGATINTFTVTPVTGSSIQMMTFHVSYSYANAKAAYLWGNMLNRTSGDAYVDASERCKLQGGRYLATNDTGSDLMAGSETYEKWQYLSEGTLCDGSTECLSQSSSASTTGHFMVAKDRAMTVAETPNVVAVLAESNTNCRVDLNQADGTLVTGDDFYTRSYVQNGSLCLAVQGNDDAWQVQCLSGDSMNAKLVDLDPYTPVTIKPSESKIAFEISLKAVNATALQVFCTQDTEDAEGQTLTIDPYTGSAYYSGTCEVDAESKSVIVRAYGVGDNNVKQKTYTLTMKKPDVKLKLYGSAPTDDETSKIDLEYSATRPYKITDEAGAVVSEGDAAWLKQRKFTGFKNAQDKDYLDGKKHDITSPGQLDGKLNNVSVSYDYTKWTYKVYDFDGNEYEDSYSAPKDTYATTSELTENDSGYSYGGSGNNNCANAPDLTLWKEYTWSATNVASIVILGDDCSLSGNLPEDGKYGLQTGTITVTKDMGKRSGAYGVIGFCQIRFVYWDDTWSDKDFSSGLECTVK